MKLSNEQVKKVAQLANLPISEEDESKFANQLSAILDYIDQLNQVNTDGVEPTFNVTGLENVLQADEVKPSLSQKDAISNGSETKDGYFVTKGVFENE